jgi:holo-[acyl-carrier protein] synthase
MIKGIGSDMIETERVRKACENERFITRNFTEDEIEMFKSKGNKIETIAANFAMKEAIVKALGTGFRGINLIDIEILRNELGKPVVTLNESLLKSMNKYEMTSMHVSCSHVKDYALGYAIAES